jgi:hypothetical protein
MKTGKKAIDSNSKICDWLEHERCKSSDLIRFIQRLHQLTFERPFSPQKLGEIKGNPIFLLTPITLNKGPNLLIAAGFHGDEPAGCWGVLRFLEAVPQSFAYNANLSFLPLVNPTGFRSCKRTNDWGEDPNRGFCHTNAVESELSREGLILMNHLDLLKSLARDGFLSLHEDVELKQFYIYTFENTDTPGPFSETLRAEEAKFFEPYPDGILDGGQVRNGVIFRHCDGSLEDFLFHEGVNRTACTETPGLSDINRRVEANMHIITAIVTFAIALLKQQTAQGCKNHVPL